MIFKNALLTLLITFLLTSFFYCQSQKKIVAQIGKEKITAKEFKTRYELMPHLSTYQNPDSIKKEFLYSLVAEKLWADEAKSEGLDTAQIIRLMLKPLTKMYIRDALFQAKIGSKIHLNPRDILNGITEFRTKLFVQVIASTDSNRIFKAFAKLKKGIQIDSLSKNGIEITGLTQPLEITFGKTKNKKIEDKLYSLKIGETTKPIETPNGWFIFKLVNKTSKAFNNAEMNEAQDRVTQILKERASKKIGTKYLDKILAGTKVNYNIPLFLALADHINSLFQEKVNLKQMNKNGYVDLDEYAAEKLLRNWGKDSVNMPLILFNKNPLSVREFVYDLTLEGFSLQKPDIQKVRNDLEHKLHYLTTQELITREGIRQGLDKSPEVTRQINWWKQNFTAKLLRDKYADSAEVTDKQVYNYYLNVNNKTNLVEQVNILEILNNSLDTMKTVLDELKDGKSFRSLAAKYTQRGWTKNKEGEFGYFPVTMFGKIGRIASTMKIGQVYGPIKVPEGFSIFKLIGKKEAKKVKLKSFENEKAKLKSDLFSKRLKYYFNKYTTIFANKFGVKVNTNVLKEIKVTDINMFTYKFMGFGGKIAAVPYTTPSYDWVKEWMKSKKVLP